MQPQIDQKIGVIIVDHGSRREESNEMLLKIVEAFRQSTAYTIVEPAHMELAEPSIKVAYDTCARQGASLIIVHPFFLLPGRHWDSDIPRLAAEASAKHPKTSYLVTNPLGSHSLMMQIIAERISECLHTHQEAQND